MLTPLKVIDVELSHPLTTIGGLDGYMGVHGLVRLHGVPIGYVEAPITSGCCEAATLSKLILEQHSHKIIQQLLANGLAAPPKLEGLRLEDLFDVPPPVFEGTLPLVTVAVCTRDRSSDLALCLDALSQLDYPALDLLVIDNAPSSDETEHLVQGYPNIRYVRELRPGLDWARNRAILEAQGEIIAYTDDDVVVDPGWVSALVKVFAENSEVMAVTGLVVPYELETEAQALFEMSGGFGKGFERKWYRVHQANKMPWKLLGAGQYGTGANMAYRCGLFDQIGSFDPALDVGTVTNGGGDLEMFFRVLKQGHTLVYEPRAIVRHRHRRSYVDLRSQLVNNGIGLYSYIVCGALSYPEERLSFFWLGLWWLVYWDLRRLWISFKHPLRLPKNLIWAELKGAFIGLGRYQKARQAALKLSNPLDTDPCQGQIRNQPTLMVPVRPSKSSTSVAVRTVELSQPLQPLVDITNYSGVRVFLTCNNQPFGSVDITNAHQSVSICRLIDAVVDQLDLKLIQPNASFNREIRTAEAIATVTQHYKAMGMNLPEHLPVNVSVSIVLATYDRPNDLRNCLRCLVAQDSPRRIEIVVVDNNPGSGLTPPVVAEFPGVMLVSESRQGLAYARNAGIVASSGEIVIATDDDVTLPPDWLEKLVAPFARPDVMVVTGNVLPLKLETPSQQFFEDYGGLGRGFERFEVSGNWFEGFPRSAVPTWELGATANAAFRTNIFSNPKISLMHEALGPGMPSGVGEDTYLFYKILKAGYTFVYEPKAYVWHKHRHELSALRSQLYNYSKGHIAYNLTTLLRDLDWRGLVQIIVALPIYYLQRIKARLLRQINYPITLILLEIAGNLAGPWSLWRSHQRVKREGRSSPYISVQKRPQVEPSQPAEEGVQSSVGVNAYGS